MDKKFLLLLCLFSRMLCGQVTYEKGYFIDNNGQKTECLIRNLDWDKNPVIFEYRLNESGPVFKAGLMQVKEFGILGVSRYLRTDVQIDRSPTDMANLSNSNTPLWVRDTVFLKVLVEGKGMLYSYNQNTYTRYFYSVDSGPVKQLVYRNYFNEVEIPHSHLIEKRMVTDLSFRQQLYTDVRCSQTGFSEIEKINYRKKELVEYFVNYNHCQASPVVIFVNSQKRDLFSLSLTPGLNYSSVYISSSDRKSGIDAGFDRRLSLRLGFEAELVLPFYRNKWAVLIEPIYHNFIAEKIMLSGPPVLVNYEAIDLSAGVRHSFFLSKSTKVFVNGHANYGFSNLHSTIKYQNYEVFNVITGINMALGCGFAYKRLSAELRFYNNKNLLRGYNNMSAKYNVIAAIIGFKFIKIKSKSTV